MDIRANLSDQLDEALLAGVRLAKGAMASGKDIEEIKGAAALLNVARQRLKDLGYDKVVQPGSVLDQISKEMGLDDGKIFELPPLDMEGNNEATSGRSICSQRPASSGL